MDLGGLFRSLSLFELVALLIFGGGFVLGFVQGPIQRILGIAVATLSLLFALNLRAPIGSWLAGYWVQDSLGYCQLIAFGASFLILFVTAALAAQIYVKPMTLFARSPIGNELLGGLLGILEAVIVLGALLMIIDSYFRVSSTSLSPNELGILRSLFHFYDDSLTARVFRDGLFPAFFWLFGWITPENVRSLFVR